VQSPELRSGFWQNTAVEGMQMFHMPPAGNEQINKRDVRLNMRALVIDDSKAMRTIIGRTLMGLDFDVVEACHGLDALEHLRDSAAFDIALVDWNMPEMNGYEFVRAVRADASCDDMLLVMVTTEAEMSQVVKALEAGANEYLMKPFTGEMLREKLQLLGLY